VDLRDPKTQKNMLVIIVALLILVLFYFFSYSKNSSRIATMKDELASRNAQIEQARLAAVRIDELRAELDELLKQWERVKQMLPSERELPELLKSLTNVGNRSGVTFELFRPLPISPVEFYAEMPIEMRVRGGYHEIGTFLSAIANLPRIVNVRDLIMQRAEKKKVELSFSAVTYLLTEEVGAGEGEF
jgi:type IV pilus assembly protein PilO